MSAAILLLFRLYLIEILHQTTTVSAISAFLFGCILLKFYIKPQQNDQAFKRMYRCILLKFYIKPQHQGRSIRFASVVSYWNSTSNHNTRTKCKPEQRVVSYWNSTSNHNTLVRLFRAPWLYLIEILHQTTTPQTFEAPLCGCILLKFYIKPQQVVATPIRKISCILLKFYIKPQPSARVRELSKGCILLKFYIKPQLRLERELACCVVSYWNSTSNHNRRFVRFIKPLVVSYWNSTSNHNFSTLPLDALKLYLIEILHQTTTSTITDLGLTELYLIEILHQTTTACSRRL